MAIKDNWYNISQDVDRKSLADTKLSLYVLKILGLKYKKHNNLFRLFLNNWLVRDINILSIKMETRHGIHNLLCAVFGNMFLHVDVLKKMVK